ncbi:hypothetical protein [Psychroserpens luteolus]|uniref:hypothetical protein n=1 Tax=Psychroserpens luteolus TaxID=2855840 RepID=UPI001E5EA83C|nr:hypothetical protein [Psychroserpens luteolus]MCD2258008.1 hypothetical protein [Psychroserpens luteolus]
MDESIVVSERNRPIWQIPIAALCFTFAVYLIYSLITDVEWSMQNRRHIIDEYIFIVIVITIGIGFCSQKRIHIDLKNSRFRPTVEIGNFKYGKWKTIHNYEYVSVFQQLLSHGSTFEVNLWYDTNKHFQLYERDSFKDALIVGYHLSEELNIDLLDATNPRDSVWVDKEAWKRKMNEHAS